MASLSFRKARSKDAPELLAFVLEVAREAEGQELDAAVVARGLDQALADPRHRQYHVAELDGRVVGACLVTTEWSDWTGRWYWWFQSVYVVPEHRGRGLDVWRRMYAYVAELAVGAGVEKLLLYVHDGNERARRAYEAVGMVRAPQSIYEARV